MFVEDVMKKDVIYVDPETNINEVAHLLTENKIHGLPVIKEGKIVGIIVENDFFTKDSVSLHLPSYISFLQKSDALRVSNEEQKEKIEALMNTKAKDIMAENVLTLRPKMKLEEAVTIFKNTKLNTFPVVDENDYLVGILTLCDVLNLM
jgi:acetoin utilization protein AcuB